MPPIRRNAASSRYGEFAFADGQQPRVGAISCASEGTGLNIPAGRNSSRASGSRAGERGAFPIAKQSLSKRRFRTRLKKPRP